MSHFPSADYQRGYDDGTRAVSSGRFAPAQDYETAAALIVRKNAEIRELKAEIERLKAPPPESRISDSPLDVTWIREPRDCYGYTLEIPAAVVDVVGRRVSILFFRKDRHLADETVGVLPDRLRPERTIDEWRHLLAEHGRK